jgi:hypothetical protein
VAAVTERRHLSVLNPRAESGDAVTNTRRWLSGLPGRLVAGPAPWPYDSRYLFAVTVEEGP